MSIELEKVEQAESLLSEYGLDCWLTFVRETSLHPDPGIDLVVGADVVRHSAFLIATGGRRTAIVANFDTAAIRARGVFPTVIGYDDDLRPALLATLDAYQPARIGLNYSTDDVTADGLTYGHWLKLQTLLSGTPYAARLTSAEPLLRSLRGRKSTTEQQHLQRAIDITEQIVAAVPSWLRVGMTERELAQRVHAEFSRHRVVSAWSHESCPVVNFGPASDFGHVGPSDRVVLEHGQLIHLDLGVKVEGYCSDLQRTWYLLRPHETAAPAPVQQAAAAVAKAIDAAAAVLRPGVPGIDVDQAARRSIVAAGYPEFKHAVGHSLGRAVHDGGVMLGPAWACYGEMVWQAVECGNVFTLELSVMTDAGCYGLEEDVRVTAAGCEFLSNFDRALRCVRLN